MKIYRFLWLLLLAVSSFAHDLLSSLYFFAIEFVPRPKQTLAVFCIWLTCLSAFAQTHTEMTLEDAQTVTGAKTITGNPFNFNNHNNHCVAGPGTTPTIDQAVALCTSLTGGTVMVDISAGYTGVESVNLFTTSTGYKAYNGPNNISICDYRANSVFATAPIYPCVVGGRIAGQLNRLGGMYYAHSPADSATGITSFNFFDGTAPSNGGLQAGGINVLMLHDTVTIGNSLTEFAGTDSEVHPDATSADNPLWQAFSYGGAVLISRSGVAQDALETSVYRAKSCSNLSPGTAKLFYCYGFNGDAQASGTSGGLYRNFTYHSRGDLLWENGVKEWSASADATATISTATESGQTATFTMTTTCAANPTLVAGALVGVSGVSVGGYNGQWIINASGCSGSSFSAFLVGTSSLSAGAGGTVQSTTPRVVRNFRSDNVIVHQPLANASGWRWQTQAAADLFVINSGVVQSGVNFAPLTAGAQGLGAPTLPWGFARIGLTSNDYLLNPVAPAAARQINLVDAGGNSNMGLNLNATNGVYQSKRAVAGCTTGASIGGTCGTDITVTWTTAFADANYSATCTGMTPTNVPAAPYIVSKAAGNIHVNYFAITAAAASYASIDCIGVHD